MWMWWPFLYWMCVDLTQLSYILVQVTFDHVWNYFMLICYDQVCNPYPSHLKLILNTRENDYIVGWENAFFNLFFLADTLSVYYEISWELYSHVS